MATYLRTSSITAGLDDLIRSAREKVYIVSPYLKLSDQIKELLNDKEREKVEVRIIFGKQELNPSELEFLQSLKYVRLYFSKNLHAKCYLNEDKMIITSMNLYEFSQQHNREMGVLIDRTDEADKLVYEDAWKDIDSLLHNADDFSYVKAPKQIKKEVHKTNTTQSKSTAKDGIGYCIRTGVEIPFDIDKPLCLSAYKKWNEYGDPDFKEKYCHFSGEPSSGKTSFGKPILNKNWKKAQQMYGL
jgi:phosphatidylserine/phosphatidylglycerophosphate/cardiolipin synthase-like enzyme